MNVTLKDLKFDCRHFRGDVPCKPHKEHGVHCIDDAGRDCEYYDRTTKKTLIIKLGAIGDVIRTTPLLRKLKEVEPRAELWWLTHTPDVIPPVVDRTLTFTAQNVELLHGVKFDMLYCLDKDREAAALCSSLNAGVKKGFTLVNGVCMPLDRAAEAKYMTGVFDDLSKQNRKSYQQEIFEICGFRFSGEEYIMPSTEGYRWKLPPKKKIVGLNTGCGGRWTSRLWPDAYWISLARALKREGLVPLLLGGEQEHKKNLRLARRSGALYLGHFPLRQFMSEMDRCDLIVTAVTMAMHLAIGLKKKIVLFNNIFNKYEFDLYGRGEILEPDFECTCYYSPTCPNNCMQYLSVERVLASCLALLKA